MGQDPQQQEQKVNFWNVRVKCRNIYSEGKILPYMFNEHLVIYSARNQDQIAT